MRTHFLYSILLLLSITLFDRCANPATLTGGEKDTIPPTLVSANPTNQSLNFHGQEFVLYFDEAINADKLSQELLITPTTENRFSHIIRKERLTIKFDDPFQDSTTYTFNFRNGVGDATEKNPVVNLKLAFSTGPYIDSLKVIGNVNDFVTDKPNKGFLVGLYLLTDTLSYDLIKPLYFTTTLKTGFFSIENIREGKYLLFGFDDDNNNLLFDASTEAFAIYPDTIDLDHNFPNDTINLQSLTVDASPLTFISARPSGKNFQVRYSKPLTEIKINKLDNIDTPIKYTPNETQSEILFYPGTQLINPDDSTGYIIHASDTLNNTQIDTVFVKFTESAKKPKEFKTNIIESYLLGDSISIQLQASKPLATIRPELFKLSIDTLIEFTLDSLLPINYDPYFRNITISSYLNTQNLIDSLNSLFPQDTTDRFNRLPGISLTIPYQALTSVEADTLTEILQSTIAKQQVKGTGTLNLKLETDYQKFEVRILSAKGNVVHSFHDLTYKSINLPPAKYSIEVLIDKNQNGRWDIANPFTNTLSEPIYTYPDKTELRENWIIDIEDISF